MRRALAVGLTLLVAGCLPRAAKHRLANPEPVGVAIVVDADRAGISTDGPEALRLAVRQELAAHGLEVKELPIEVAAKQRLSEARLASVRTAAGTPWVCLVELRARFFSQLEGRYRWEVAAKLTVGKGTETVQDAFTVPVILQLENEREAEAIAQAANDIAVRLGALIDGFLPANEVVPVTSQAPAAPAAPKGPRAIYFAMVDRFEDGDPKNNGDANPADPQAFHGGDVRGLIDRLDWIQEQGFDTVWISPVFTMRTEKWHGYGAFHGYWTWRLDGLEPRLTDEKTLRELSDALHARGMKLVLDVVLNHVGPDAPLLREHPDWFHHQGGITDWNDPQQLVNGDVHGLSDFAQENPEVDAYLVGSARRWLRGDPA
jgi:hypothetical protein